jgi:hypothetical protein
MSEFLRELSTRLAGRAVRVSPGDPDFASIDLAAHLFAAATYLRERYGNAAMDTHRPPAALDLAAALRFASDISRTDPVDSYLEICAALVGIDSLYREDRMVTASLLPSQTEIERLDDGGRLALFGTVEHWIRPVNPWCFARVHREEMLPFVNVYPPTPADDLEALGMLWHRGEVPDARHVRIRDLPPRADGFRIALCPLFCGAHPRFAINDAGDQFTVDRTRPYSDPTALAAHLSALAPQLEAYNVQLLVLPELAVTVEARAQLVDMLAASRCLAGIVAGSFHVWREGHDDPVNEAVVYTPRGVAWRHCKRGYFRITDRDVERFSQLFEPPVSRVDHRVIEGIQRGSTLEFWDTRIGRLAVIICADAIARESMIATVERVRPDLLLILSLSMETSEFALLGEQLARRGISALYVNAGCACALASDAAAALVHVALPTPSSAPPSRVRWTNRSAPLEMSQFRDRPWLEADDSVQVLGTRDGIVIDIGRHLRWRPSVDP